MITIDNPLFRVLRHIVAK